jgi:hypothetical protein
MTGSDAAENANVYTGNLVVWQPTELKERSLSASVELTGSVHNETWCHLTQSDQCRVAFSALVELKCSPTDHIKTQFRFSSLIIQLKPCNCCSVAAGWNALLG